MTGAPTDRRVTHTHNAYLAWCRDRYGILLILTILNYVILMVLPAGPASTLIETLVVAATALFALDVCAAPRRARIRRTHGCSSLFSTTSVQSCVLHPR